MTASHREAYEVHLDAAELMPPVRVGTLYRASHRSALPASFEYDPTWLKQNAFMLDPRLELWRGEQHPPNGQAFGIFLDSAPDRWGRVLMERREASQARRAQRKPRALQELDFLLGVQDAARMGALRLRSVQGGPFLDSSDSSAPPVTSLRELAHISRRMEEPGIEEMPEYERWLAMLIAPGSSLGGARPKANFTDADGSLWIAKFPAQADRVDVGGWEYLAHQLAKQAGIEVPNAQLHTLTERHRTFCVQRFDRHTALGTRRMFASAMTLLEYRDGEPGASYLELAEFIASHGAKGHVDQDLAQLFRRVVFNVLIGNRDDHLRNHGFIRHPAGWRLAPAYDVNPNPHKAEHSLTLDGQIGLPDLDLVLDTAGFYRLKPIQAQTIVADVRQAISSWPAQAKQLGLPRSEIDLMSTVIAPTSPGRQHRIP
jgi:serine/threonine-protein kinase HipA